MTHAIIQNVIPESVIQEYLKNIWEVNRYFNDSPTEFTLAGKTYDIANTLADKYRVHDFVVGPAQEFVGSERIFASGWQLRLDRPSNASELLEWHRDYDYFQKLGPRGCVAWIPLTQLSEESGGIEVANGSFTLENLTSEKKIKSWEGRKPHQVWECNYQGGDTITAMCNPGDIVFFDLLTPHRSLLNRSSKTRTTLQIRFFAWDENTNATRSDIEKMV
ncbi:phytanoyl-CoA dioxygenase family protein [Denitrobaculum tricleocarpae]|nr:phytanoyl-CoA dioxygenase family protein [Denitrobaculum tricleocarpae]